MPNWTPEQSKAINLRNTNLLVSAAAGSGKTAVLVERIIKLITEDMIDIDKLLIVTFTNAAAGEMRERILKSLTEKIEEKSGKEDFLRKQLTLLNKAFITTIHSFCIDVVRKNFHLVDVDPSFRIGDNTEKNILIQESLDELLEKEYEEANEEFLNLVEAFGTNREDVKLQDLILRIYYFIQSKPYPEKWLREVVKEFNIDRNNFENSPWVKTIVSDINMELQGGRDIIRDAINICNKINGPVEYEEALIDDLNNIENLLKSLDSGLESFNLSLEDINHKKFNSIRGQRKLEIDENLKDEVNTLRKRYKEKIIKPLKDSLLTKGIDYQISKLNYMYPMMDYLTNLVLSFSNLYRDKKHEKGILDFNDLEHYALKILEDEEVSKSYSNQFSYIFIDEYQDSNIVQETLISRIKRDNNLFLVGDVKQSIYRFRMADPSLFIEKYNSYSEKEDGSDTKVILSKNFRSRYEVLEGINYIFSKIMTTSLGEIEYDKKVYLYNGMNFEDVDDPSIDVDIIEKSIDELENIDEELQELSNAEVEAKVVAKRIKDIRGKETYDAKNKTLRPIDYRDIVILLRATKNWAPIFMDVLLREGIPVYSDDSSGYFDVIEVKIFLDLLKLIDNKLQDLPLLSTMRSAIGKFSTDDLIKIRIKYKDGHYHEAVKKYIENEQDELKDRLKIFIDKLDRWAREVRYVKLDQFIWDLLIETGYYHYIGAMPGGAQRQANLRILVDRAETFEKSSINGLFNFIRFIDKLSKSGGDMSTAKILGENENLVRIMSVHKSKGLEFPVVICPGLGKKFNLRDTYQDVLLHKDLGLGPKFVDIEKRIYGESLPQIAIKKKLKVESLSEEMRILYVAMTRAIDKLILIGSVKNIPNESKKWCNNTTPYNLLNCGSLLDWILTPLTKHNDGEVLRELAGVEGDLDLESSDSKWNIRILNREDLLLLQNIEDKEKSDHKDDLINFKFNTTKEFQDLLEKRFNFSYDYSDAVKIPSKLSVTDIKRADASNLERISYKIPKLNKMPKFIENEKTFTGAQKGTIMHFVMQHLDYEKIKSKEDITNHIDMMVVNELLTEEESKVVDIEKISNFLNSEIGKRIINSNKYFKETPFVLRKRAENVINGLKNCSEDLLIQGIIDCYFEEEDDLILVDYKTDYIPNGDINSIIEKYKSQLDIYKEGLEKITNKKVKESYIYLFNIDKGVKIL